MIRQLSAAFGLLIVTAGFAAAQAPAQKIVDITDISVDPRAFSPEYNIGLGPQKKSTSQPWLWVEVSFVYNPAVRNPPPLDDLKLTYYILLNDVTPQNRTGTLLVGTVTHTGILPGTDTRRSVMMVSPQVLKRFFDGKLPSNMSTAYQAIGVTAAYQGQTLGELSIGKGKGQPQWWTRFQQGPPGLVLSKDQTPFAPLFYDYFEATKPTTPGAP